MSLSSARSLPQQSWVFEWRLHLTALKHVLGPAREALSLGVSKDTPGCKEFPFSCSRLSPQTRAAHLGIKRAAGSLHTCTVASAHPLLCPPRLSHLRNGWQRDALTGRGG